MKHLLEQVLDQDADSELHKTVATNKINSPHDLVSQSDDWIDKLQYRDNAIMVDLSKGDAGLL